MTDKPRQRCYRAEVCLHADPDKIHCSDPEGNRLKHSADCHGKSKKRQAEMIEDDDDERL